jgi:hypothetical protein
MTPIALVGLLLAVSIIGAAIGDAVVVYALLWKVKPYASAKVAAERKRAADAERKAWHNIRASADAEVGTFERTTHAVVELMPTGLAITARYKETAELPLGHVRVSYEIGIKQ